MKRWMWSLGVGALCGLAAGVATRAAPSASPVEQVAMPPPAALANGQSGPGFSCPARAVAEPLSSELPPDLRSLMPPAPAHLDGPTCSSRPAPVHLVLDEKGLASPAADSDPFWFASYRGQPLLPMGDESLINGVMMKVGQLHTEDDPNAVLRFYGLQFEANHLQPVSGTPRGRGGPMYLSFTPKGEPMHTLILVPQAHGTMILASVGTPKVEEQKAPSDVPMPKDAVGVRVDEIHDGASVQRDVSFQVKSDPDVVRKFYEQELGKRGFESDAPDLARPEQDGKLWRQSYHRGEQNVSVSLTTRPGTPVAVSLMWIDGQSSSEGAKP